MRESSSQIKAIYICLLTCCLMGTLFGNTLRASIRKDSFRISAENLVKNLEVTSLFDDSQNLSLQSEGNALWNSFPSSIEPTSAYIVIEQIIIRNDQDLDSYGFPGNGSKVNPYLIENYDILPYPLNPHGIWIRNTTKHFIIQNCYLDTKYGVVIDRVANNTATIVNNLCLPHNSGYNYEGILIISTNFVTIQDNYCEGKSYGIALSNSTGTQISNNTCNFCSTGIKIDLSTNITLIDNSCNGNSCGYKFFDTFDSDLISNNCNDSTYGIYLSGSSNLTITANNCSYSEYGIYLSSSSNLTIKNNNLLHAGLTFSASSISDFYNHTIENNLVNNKPLSIYFNLNGALFSDSLFGQLILINCTNSVISNQHISKSANSLSMYWCNDSVIIDNNIIGNPIGCGILLNRCSNCTVRNNICNGNAIGIRIFHSSKITMRNNSCNKNNNFAIALISSSDNEIIENDCSDNFNKGIYVYSLSGTNILSDNICNCNSIGIAIGFTISGQLIIQNNTCNNNDKPSPEISVGIYLYFTRAPSTISNNTCNGNFMGIFLRATQNSFLLFNEIMNNYYSGVAITQYSMGNFIHHNTFIDNNLRASSSSSQGADNCGDNFWYDAEAEEGNYWSDWSGSGNYTIAGTAGAVDMYPSGGAPPTTQVNISILIPIILIIPIIIRKRRVQK